AMTITRSSARQAGASPAIGSWARGHRALERTRPTRSNPTLRSCTIRPVEQIQAPAKPPLTEDSVPRLAGLGAWQSRRRWRYRGADTPWARPLPTPDLQARIADKVAALRTEAGLTTILDGIGEGFCAVDRDWRILLFNSEAARHFCCKPEDVIGRVLWEAFQRPLDGLPAVSPGRRARRRVPRHHRPPYGRGAARPADQGAGASRQEHAHDRAIDRGANLPPQQRRPRRAARVRGPPDHLEQRARNSDAAKLGQCRAARDRALGVACAWRARRAALHDRWPRAAPLAAKRGRALDGGA